MLRMVPRAPAKVSVKELCKRLSAGDFPVTKRIVERDLNELSQVFPIVADSCDKPFGWSWLRNASSFDLPALTLPEALTLTLVEQHLRHHLPPSAVDALWPHFRSAARTSRPLTNRCLRAPGSARFAACRPSSRCLRRAWTRNANASFTSLSFRTASCACTTANATPTGQVSTTRCIRSAWCSGAA